MYGVLCVGADMVTICAPRHYMLLVPVARAFAVAIQPKAKCAFQLAVILLWSYIVQEKMP